MKTSRIVRTTVLIVASVLTLNLLRAEQAGHTPTNRKDQSHMTNEKVIMLIEAKIQPERHAEIVEAVGQYVPLVRAEPGVEAFYVATRKDDPNTLVFYEVYKSQAGQDFHLKQEFTKKFLATLNSAQVEDRVRTRLVELPPQEQSAKAN